MQIMRTQNFSRLVTIRESNAVKPGTPVPLVYCARSLAHLPLNFRKPANFTFLSVLRVNSRKNTDILPETTHNPETTRATHKTIILK